MQKNIFYIFFHNLIDKINYTQYIIYMAGRSSGNKTQFLEVIL